MSVRAVSHVSVGVNDMERSLIFYRDVLGLSVSMDQTENLPQTGDIPPQSRRAVYLRWSDGDDESFIVLDSWKRTKAPIPKELFDIGVHHFSFWVDDMAPIMDRAKQHGFTVIVSPLDRDSSEWGEASGRIIRTGLLKDPDGTFIQLDQRV